jgi:hypothetical protein
MQKILKRNTHGWEDDMVIEKSERAERKSRSDAMRELETRISQLRKGYQMNGRDPLYIPKEVIPEGWEYHWGRMSYDGGRPDMARELELNRCGWTPVPPERHPDLVPKDYTGRAHQALAVILINGLMLLERPEIFGIEDRQRRSRGNYEQLTSIKGLKNFLGDNEDVPGLQINNSLDFTHEKGVVGRRVLSPNTTF